VIIIIIFLYVCRRSGGVTRRKIGQAERLAAADYRGQTVSPTFVVGRFCRPPILYTDRRRPFCFYADLLSVRSSSLNRLQQWCITQFRRHRRPGYYKRSLSPCQQ